MQSWTQGKGQVYGPWHPYATATDAYHVHAGGKGYPEVREPYDANPLYTIPYGRGPASWSHEHYPPGGASKGNSGQRRDHEPVTWGHEHYPPGGDPKGNSGQRRDHEPVTWGHEPHLPKGDSKGNSGQSRNHAEPDQTPAQPEAQNKELQEIRKIVDEIRARDARPVGHTAPRGSTRGRGTQRGRGRGGPRRRDSGKSRGAGVDEEGNEATNKSRSTRRDGSAKAGRGGKSTGKPGKGRGGKTGGKGRAAKPTRDPEQPRKKEGGVL
jgi:hypothetical protein